MNIIELAKEAGFDKEYFDNQDCPCEDCNFLREPIERFASLVRAEALAEPVKQEPVAVVDEIGTKLDGTPIFNAVGKVEVGQPLYAAPVDAKAIRAEALEEAAKKAEECLASKGLYLVGIAAAIRRLK